MSLLYKTLHLYASPFPDNWLAYGFDIIDYDTINPLRQFHFDLSNISGWT